MLWLIRSRIMLISLESDGLISIVAANNKPENLVNGTVGVGVASFFAIMH